MFTVDGVRKLHSWTHASLNLALDHLSTIPASAYVAELPGFGLRTLRAQTIHVFNSEAFWTHALQGLRYTDRTADDCPFLADARGLQNQACQSTHAYLSNLTDQQLNANAELPLSNGDVAVRTPALVLHHVLTHAFHHKGQIVAMCRALGYPAPDTDLRQFE